jgi:hypothetical protein
VAIFAAACPDVPAFVSRSSLRRVDDLDPRGDDVNIFAKRNGWTASTGEDTYYVREFAKYQTIEVLVHQTAGTCTVYLTA